MAGNMGMGAAFPFKFKSVVFSFLFFENRSRRFLSVPRKISEGLWSSLRLQLRGIFGGQQPEFDLLRRDL